MNTPTLDERFRSRKFILTCFVQLVATIALFTGLMDGGDFAQIASVTVAAYSVANAATGWKKK